MYTNFSFSNQTIQCITNLQMLSTIALGRTNSTLVPGLNLDAIDFVLIASSNILLFLSVLFLLSSLVIFIISRKKFFTHDVNILHFNNTLSILLAIINSMLLPILNRIPSSCLAVSFFDNLLWSNVFLSSLSIAIVVFYTIWVVSINHTARKLYKYLIPIGWCVSLVWAVAWVVYDKFTEAYRENLRNSCFFSHNLFFSNSASVVLSTVILLVNAILLVLSLVRIWIVLKRQNRQEGEFRRLRRVAIGGILLIPALGLTYISIIALQIFVLVGVDRDPFGNVLGVQNVIRISLIIYVINSPIGILHFILITCQIKETILQKYFWCCCRKTAPAQVAHSLRLNIAKTPKAKQDTPDNVPSDTVPANESTVCANEYAEPIN